MPTTSVLIRRAQASDGLALGHLGATLMRLHHGFDPKRFMTPPRDAEDGYGWFLRSQLDSEDALVLVAEQAGQVVGYCYAAIEPRSWKDLRDEAGYVHDLLVDETARGRGIGSELVREVLAWLSKKGAPRVVLMTAESNPAARHLFGRFGFRPTMVEMTRELDQPKSL